MSSVTPKKPKGDGFAKIVSWFVDVGIVSEEQWIATDFSSYVTEMTTPAKRLKAKRALSVAKKYISCNKNAFDYLTGVRFCDVTDTIAVNSVFQLFAYQGFDPMEAGYILMCCLKTLYRQGNVVWFSGGESSGQTELVSEILTAVPLTGVLIGRVSPSHLRDCTEKLVIWWRDAKIDAESDERLKSLLEGSRIRVHMRRTIFRDIYRTPVIITTDADNGVDVTVLTKRVWRFNFSKSLPRTFHRITTSDIRDFMTWIVCTAVTEYPTNEPETFEIKTYSEDEIRRRVSAYI